MIADSLSTYLIDDASVFHNTFGANKNHIHLVQNESYSRVKDSGTWNSRGL